jgi:hypothetical protein
LVAFVPQAAVSNRSKLPAPWPVGIALPPSFSGAALKCPDSSVGCPKFAEKLKDIVGLYVDPPAHAVVLSVDEKSQIQALDRTQPGLPMKPGRAGT